MIPFRIRRYVWAAVLFAAVVIAGFVGTKIYQAGGAAEKARTEAARQQVQNDLIEAGKKLRQREVQLNEETADLERRAQEHEDAISANPDNHCLPTDERLQRLHRRWGAP